MVRFLVKGIPDQGFDVCSHHHPNDLEAFSDRFDPLMCLHQMRKGKTLQQAEPECDRRTR